MSKRHLLIPQFLLHFARWQFHATLLLISSSFSRFRFDLQFSTSCQNSGSSCKSSWSRYQEDPVNGYKILQAFCELGWPQDPLNWAAQLHCSSVSRWLRRLMSLRICYALPRTTQKIETSSMMERLHCFIQRTPACASPWSGRTRVQLLTFADQAWPHLKGWTARVLYLKSYIYIINQWEIQDPEMEVLYNIG